MTIEEKAKAYDEALTKSKEFLTLCEKCGAKDTIDFLKDIFSELKESEDERIGKWIKKELENKYVEDGIVNNVLADKAFAWLEKQKHLYETTKDRFYLEGFEEGQLYERQKEQRLTECNEENERIRKEIIEMLRNYASVHYITKKQFSERMTWLEKQCCTKKDIDDAYLKGVTDTKNEIEKQYEANYQIRKDIATFIFNYGGDIKDRAKWMNYLGIKVSLVASSEGKLTQIP